MSRPLSAVLTEDYEARRARARDRLREFAKSELGRLAGCPGECGQCGLEVARRCELNTELRGIEDAWVSAACGLFLDGLSTREVL